MRKWIVVMALAAAAAGCQGRTFMNVGKGRQGDEYGMLLKSVDAYAKKSGLTRDQAIRQLREEADRNAREGHANSCGASCAVRPGAERPAVASGGTRGPDRRGTPAPEVMPAGYDAVDPPPGR